MPLLLMWHCYNVALCSLGSLLRQDGSRRPRSHRNCLPPYGWFLRCSGLEATALRRARHCGQSLHPVRCGVQESSQVELCPHLVLGLPRRVCRARRHLSTRSGAFLRGRPGSAGVLCRIPWKAQGEFIYLFKYLKGPLKKNIAYWGEQAFRGKALTRDFALPCIWRG